MAPAVTAGRVPAGAAALQADVSTAIARAAFREWARTGYATLSMEAVARRAGVGKAALYRRWPSKLAMAADLLSRIGSRAVEVPDTGTLAGDVRAFHWAAARLMRRPPVARVLSDLHAEMVRDAPLAAAVRAGIQTERRERARAMLRRAVRRGELPVRLDEELALDLLAAPIYWRLVVTRGALAPGDLDRLAVATCAALRAL